eukprot:5886865-Pyramimonas_sp.AAC.1
MRQQELRPLTFALGGTVKTRALQRLGKRGAYIRENGSKCRARFKCRSVRSRFGHAAVTQICTLLQTPIFMVAAAEGTAVKTEEDEFME